MAIITLTTDFGLQDGNVGVMKGVIANITPQTQIIDISHFIPPQDVFSGALILSRSVPYFPDHTIHIGVVDPGVGTQRRPIAARLGKHFFIGPDNGLCTLIYQAAQKQGAPIYFFHLDKPQYWLSNISHVFHGRDIFSPVAAHLAGGAPLEALGTRIYDPIQLQVPEPRRTKDGWAGEIIHIDHFGNIATNILHEHIDKKAVISVNICGHTIFGLNNTFGERPPGELIALFGSTGNLIISIVNGDAAQHINAHRGDPVEVSLLNT